MYKNVCSANMNQMSLGAYGIVKNHKSSFF